MAEGAERQRYFVPVVYADTGYQATPDGMVFGTLWSSGLWAMNPTGEVQQLRDFEVAAGTNQIRAGCTIGVLPNAGEPDRSSSICLNSRIGLTFISFTADPRLVLTATIERLRYRNRCILGDGIEFIAQGMTPLPIYQSPFAAGSTTFAGPVDAGSMNQFCAYEQHRYERRVNVTLANLSDEASTFEVAAIGVRQATEPVYAESVVLAPREVRQINDLPIPIPPIPSGQDRTNVNFTIFVWIRISADRPYLSYVSTSGAGEGPGLSLPGLSEPARRRPLRIHE